MASTAAHAAPRRPSRLSRAIDARHIMLHGRKVSKVDIASVVIAITALFVGILGFAFWGMSEVIVTNYVHGYSVRSFTPFAKDALMVGLIPSLITLTIEEVLQGNKRTWLWLGVVFGLMLVL